MCLYACMCMLAQCVSACTHLVRVYILFGEGHNCEPKSNYKYEKFQ